MEIWTQQKHFFSQAIRRVHAIRQKHTRSGGKTRKGFMFLRTDARNWQTIFLCSNFMAARNSERFGSPAALTATKFQLEYAQKNRKYGNRFFSPYKFRGLRSENDNKQRKFVNFVFSESTALSSRTKYKIFKIVFLTFSEI